jgi:metallophosphoesterase superfamily enzyme
VLVAAEKSRHAMLITPAVNDFAIGLDIEEGLAGPNLA